MIQLQTGAEVQPLLHLHAKSKLLRMRECKGDELAAERRKLHNEKLRNLCYSPNVIRAIK